MHLGALGQRDLRGDVRAAAKPVQPQPAAGRQRGPLQRPIADDAGAQQRRQLTVAVAAWQMMGESRRDRCEFSVAAVAIPTGVAGIRAQVLVAASAVRAYAAGVPQPGYPDPVADVELVTRVRADLDDLADHLVAGGYLFPVHGKVALGDVQIGPAYPACAHGNQEFGRPGPRHRRADVFQRLGVDRTGPTHPPRMHGRRGH